MVVTRRTAAGLAVALLLCGCSDSAPSEPLDREAPGARPVALADADGAGYAWRFSVAPDGRTALMARSDGFFPQTRDSSIYELTRQPDGSWGEGTEVPFVDGSSSDIDPVHDASGSRVWFSSIRPVDGRPRTDVDVWYADRRPDGSWGQAVHVPQASSPGDDLYPSIDRDGSLLVGSDRSGSGFDIWRVPRLPSGGWAAAAPLPEPVTTTGWEFNPAVTPDGAALVFTARSRSGGAGEGDLFVARAQAGGWSDPVPVEAANTAADEYHPSFSPDGSTLYFVRRGTLHEVPWAG